jgi:Family of unknown function (DUF6183)
VDAAVRNLVASLAESESLQPQWEVVDEWVADGDVERLRETAQALLGAPGRAVPDWAARSIVDRTLRGLTLTPRLDFALAACELARSADVREVASLAASGQSVDVCAELVASGEEADEEFLACLVQELVLRVEHLEREPFAAFWRRVGRRGHALGWLPLRLCGPEASISLPSYTLDGMVYTMPDSYADHAASAGTAEVGPVEGETTSGSDGERIRSAVATWLDESNGRAEARVFALRSDAPAVPVSAALAAARLDSLGGTTPNGLASIASRDAFHVLFSAASTGGAYDHGARGAYGRLGAWRTVSALAGARPDERLESVAERAEDSQWFVFESDSGWFYGVAWDIGLAAVSPDGRRLAVLAATDTD